METFIVNWFIRNKTLYLPLKSVLLIFHTFTDLFPSKFSCRFFCRNKIEWKRKHSGKNCSKGKKSPKKMRPTKRYRKSEKKAFEKIEEANHVTKKRSLKISTVLRRRKSKKSIKTLHHYSRSIKTPQSYVTALWKSLVSLPNSLREKNKLLVVLQKLWNWKSCEPGMKDFISLWWKTWAAITEALL